jgi:hypothetical protein
MHTDAYDAHLLLLTQLRREHQSGLDDLRSLPLVEIRRCLLDVHFNLSRKVVGIAIEQVKLVERSLKLWILPKTLKLRIKRRHRWLVALECTESDVHHTLFEVGDLDAAGIVLEFDLILYTADIVICEGSMQV